MEEVLNGGDGKVAANWLRFYEVSGKVHLALSHLLTCRNYDDEVLAPDPERRASRLCIPGLHRSSRC